MKNRQICAALVIMFSYLASSKVPASGEPVLGSAEAGKAKSVLCSGCHGVNGEGKNMPDGQPSFPRLAGQVPGYFIKAIYDYKKDLRNDAMMGAIAKGLTDIDIANLAAYYTSLK